ncbi:MAG: prolyl oligopeptidase family serine peptidase [Pseudomonadota bacterium]
MRIWMALALGLAMAVPGGQAAACGADTDCLLTIDGVERTYRIRMPEGSTSPVGAVLYAHGYKGSAAGAMRNKALAEMANDLGIAMVAAKSAGDDWKIPGVPAETQDGKTTDGAAEFAYFDALLDAMATRYGIDPARVMMTGFSAGGMMTWNLACHRGDRFAGFAPVAGTFWRPVPDTCPSPASSLVHIHGTEDRIVPLSGRPIAQTHQGDVARALAMYTRHGAFGEAVSERRGELACEVRTAPDGRFLDFCLFEGGHSFRISHLRMAWDRLMTQ